MGSDGTVDRYATSAGSDGTVDRHATSVGSDGTVDRSEQKTIPGCMLPMELKWQKCAKGPMSWG